LSFGEEEQIVLIDSVLDSSLSEYTITKDRGGREIGPGEGNICQGMG